MNAPKNLAIFEHRQNQSLGGSIASGKTPLFFVDKGVKTIQKVYQWDIL